MIAAALEAATRPGSVALSVRGELHETPGGAGAHASDLLALLEKLCAGAGIGPRSIELLVVGLGPGSFTGLRVAAASALGFARGARARCAGLSAPEVAAFTRLAPGQSGLWASEVRKGEFAAARVRHALHGAELEGAPELVTAPELLERLPALGPALGPGWTASPLLAPALPVELPESYLRPTSAGELLALALERETHAELMCGWQLEPLYLAPFRATPRAR